MEVTDLIFSFSEQLDIAVVAADTEFDELLAGTKTCKELITLLLEFFGTFVIEIFAEYKM